MPLRPSASGLLLLLLVAAAPGRAQFLSEPANLTTTIGYAKVPVRYKEVPAGICEQDPGVKSFAGYADVDKDQHIFFWFFEARNADAAEAPLTLWLNGGPGSSSMAGLFQGQGPCGVDDQGNVYNNPYSWTNATNMLFVDQPTQVGFSYSIPVRGRIDADTGGIVELRADEPCPAGAEAYCGTFSRPDPALTANSTVAAAPYMWKMLQGFLGAFPKYARSNLTFATESYGGHYAPVFSHYIQEQNAKELPGTRRIDLKNILIGNGWFDSRIGMEAYYNFSVANTYDYAPFDEPTQKSMRTGLYDKGACLDQLNACDAGASDTDAGNQICRDADDYCSKALLYPWGQVATRSYHDLRYLDPNPFPYSFYSQYLNQPHVLEALGAFTNHTDSSATVSDAFVSTGDISRELRITEHLREFVVKARINVALYAGDADFVCNWLGVQETAERVGVPGWGGAGFVNVTSANGVVHAQTRQAGLFSFTRVIEAGHQVPFFRPAFALDLLSRTLRGKDVATGQVAVADGNYVSQGPRTSAFHNGNATIQWDVVPDTLTYNTTTSKPGAPWRDGGKTAAAESRDITARRKRRSTADLMAARLP